jgi:ArsR family transcriptional regulator
MNDARSTDQMPGPCGRLDLADAAADEGDEELAILARALSHPMRLQIIRLLERRTTCVCGEIVDQLPLAQSTVSEHLRILKEAGLIRGEVDGPRVCYCLEPGALARLKTLVDCLC